MFDGIAALRRELEAAVRTDDPPVRKIRELVHRTLAFFWDRRFFFALIHRNELRPDAEVRAWLRHREALAGVIRRTLEAAMRAGDLRRIDARIATEMLLGLMRGVNRYRAAGDRLDDLVETVVDVFLSGVAQERALRSARPRRRRG